MKRIVVVGAGMGGLTTAAALARSGFEVSVLEAHTYAGGCAGTFYYQGFQFDAGATLAGGFKRGGPMDQIARATGLQNWPVRPSPTPIVVHLPDGLAVERGADDSRWQIREDAFGADALSFFRWQEAVADAVWPLAIQGLPWPPQNPAEIAQLVRLSSRLARSGPRTALPKLVRASATPLASYLPPANQRLRDFIDGQLLISAQTTSSCANALYSAAALDLPRQGVVEVEGGMGGLAKALAHALTNAGGRIIFRQRVSRVHLRNGRPVSVETDKGEIYPADIVVFNLPASDIKNLLPEDSPPGRKMPSATPPDGWGAVTLYLGVQDELIPPGFPLHHQLLTGDGFGEAASLFLSLSPKWDESRAPAGMRAVTLSTHTARKPWWDLFTSNRPAYEARKAQYQARILALAENLLPGLDAGSTIQLPGTPVTFQRFTGRTTGWVGGFPQTNLLRARGPRLGPGMWMVGDSIFPGQSTAAVGLGGLRVAGAILGSYQALFSAGEEPVSGRLPAAREQVSRT